jgi:alkanesulfonate monooxygenase SsuD/methylene tetrahydromethanopterin reductase-like flavin-dependent oxidoreductase (luciferase family)
MLRGGPEFDWDGKYFHLKKLHTDPVSIQRPWPAVMAAGFSPKGREFAARAADVLFLNVTELDQVPGILADVETQMARHNRTISVFTMGHVVCRPTRREAEDYFHYFAEEMEDPEGQAYYLENRGAIVKDGGRQLARPMRDRFHRATGLNYAGAYPGVYPFVGTPDDIADEMARMSATGLAGCTVAFVDYLKEIPYFIAEVLPRLERLGVREPAAS